RGVLTRGDGLRVWDVGTGEALDDAPFTHDSVVAVGGCPGRWDADDAREVVTCELVDLVLCPTGQVLGFEWRTLAGQALLVHPFGESRCVDHWFPTSSSM